MTTRNLQTRLLFDGGWATDFGPTAAVSVGQDGTIRVPYLIDAENCVYGLDGGPMKIGGTERINSVALNSGATTNIRGLVDYWKSDTGASQTQYRIVHVGDELMADGGDGSFSTILGALGARDTGSVPSYAVYDDDLIIMSDSIGEVPLKYNGTSTSVLGTNTPDFAFGVMHKNRFFAAGVASNKSRVYYSEPLPNGADGDWNAVEAGFFDVDPDDGDEVRALVSHKGVLFIFKGPNDGSIHTLRGDTPLGGVTAFASAIQPVPFELDIFIHGVGAVSHNSTFRFRDDVGFIDAKTASIRSLNATEKFGDFREASLSFPINDYLLNRVNKASLKKSWAADDVSRGSALITLATDTETDNNVVLNMDYRFDPPRWSIWPAISAECLASVIDTDRSNRQSIFLGDTAGFVRRTNTLNKSIDETTAINYKVTLPYLDFGNPVSKKTFARGAVGIEPKGDYNATFGWSRDNNAQQTTTFSQGGGDVLGGATTAQAISFFAQTVDADLTAWVSDSSPHDLSVGDTVTLSGSSYNGSYTVLTVGDPVAHAFEVAATYIGSPNSGFVQKITTENPFILGTSTLSGSKFLDRFFSLEEGGEFRSIQFQLLQAGLDQDIAAHSLFAEVELGADSTEN
jgi:hypothetical protein